MHKLLLMLIIVSTAASLSAKNLRFLQTVQPYNYELLDVEIDGDLMIVPAGLGGAEIYDISDPRNPEPRGNMALRGCNWDRSYNWDIGDGFAIGTARDCGFGVFDITDPELPRLFALHHPDADFIADPISSRKASMEDVEIVGDVAIFAAHFSGLVFYDMSNRSNPKYMTHVRIDNAWSLTVNDGIAYVANGESGISIVSFRNVNTPHVLSEAQTSGAARDIQYKDGLVFVAVGTAGVDVFDVSNSSNPVLLDNYKTTGFNSRVAVHLPYISASSWDQVHVLKWDGARLKLHGYKDTGGRVMAVGSPGGAIVYSAEWEVMRVFEVDEIVEPDIDVSTRRLDYGEVDIGDTKVLTIEIENSGGAALEIVDIAFTYDDFSVAEPAFTILANTKKKINVTYTAQNSTVGGSMILFTNDPDEAQVFVRMLGNNAAEVQEGDVARIFELPVIANGSGTISLEDLRGRVVVLAMFASW
jgi:hypothetical protein